MNVLITGMSGTGKSTVIGLLRRRGFTTIETDDPEWLVPDGNHDSGWLWNEAKIARLLDESHDADLFVSGTRENQGSLYSRFDHIVLLTAPIDVLLDRVATRLTNPYGSHRWEREKIARDKAEFEPVLRAGATVEYDTSTLSPDEIADRLEALVRMPYLQE